MSSHRELTVAHRGLVYGRRPGESIPGEALEHGMLLFDGQPVPESQARLIRATLLGTYRDLPPLVPADMRGLETRQDVIPGALARGEIPLLSGPPKVGKSTLLAQLAASLVVPGRRWLGAFEPARFTDEENARGELNIVYINAENPVGAMHREFLSTGLLYDSATSDTPFYVSGGDDVRALVVMNLEELGGPDVFDLTVPENFDQWAYRLSFCPCPQPDLIVPPVVVIVDGVTAIAGLDRAALWYAEFRRLMRMIDVPTAVVAGHAGLGQKHAFGATDPMSRPDSLWSYSTRDLDVRPGSRRLFSITPRLDGPDLPETPVERGPDKWLRLRTMAAHGPKESDAQAAPTSGSRPRDEDVVSEDERWEQDVLGRLRAAGAAGLTGTELCGAGRYGKLRRAAAQRLLGAKKVTVQVEGQSQRWRLADAG